MCTSYGCMYIGTHVFKSAGIYVYIKLCWLYLRIFQRICNHLNTYTDIYTTTAHAYMHTHARVHTRRRTIGTHGESLSFPWSKSRALDLIYSNIRGLLMVNNSNVVKQSMWETMRTSRIKRGKTTLDFKLSTQLNVNGLTCVRIQCVVPLSRDRLTEVGFACFGGVECSNVYTNM